jgi:hypothetical protein
VSARPPRRRSAGGVPDPVKRIAKPFATGLAEVLAIAREMLAIPAAIALGLAERLGLVVLAAWRIALPVLEAALRQGRRALAVAEREVTPARAVAAVLIAAAVLLAIAQFVDYREVRAGVPAYSGVENVAPPPQVAGTTEQTGSAHVFLPLLVSVATVAVVALAMSGRWRLPRLLVVLGVAVVALSLLVDMPQGLDEGQVAVQFEGAEASLLSGFWVQLMAGAVIALCGPLLALALGPDAARRRRRAPRRARRERGRPRIRRPRLARSPAEGAQP